MFIYRISLFHAIHFQKWLINGCPNVIKTKKLRNDMLDFNFATFATYFDGLLTKDKKCLDSYLEGQLLLNEVLIPKLRKQ